MNTEINRKKIAIITGAGTGIGAAIAYTLANKNWKVILAGRTKNTLEDVANTIKTGGGEAKIVICDVTNLNDVKNLITATGNHLDALIHSAGQGHCLTIDELDEEEWKNTMDVAVTGAFLTAKYALPVLRETQGGDGFIIQIGSLASGGTWELEVGYGTAKGAQVKFALHLDSYMKVEAAAGGRKIHVHAVCPGTVDTPFWDRIPQRSADPNLTLTANEVAWMVDKILENPTITAEELSAIRPREEIIVHRLSPYEKWDNIIALKHESHP
jgi:NAD(P)-dependent dehydrogenase (short-subunit alcohol dehydrogenase family)